MASSGPERQEELFKVMHEDVNTAVQAVKDKLEIIDDPQTGVETVGTITESQANIDNLKAGDVEPA